MRIIRNAVTRFFKERFFDQAAAVRKAERAAFAMEARGFTGQPRTEFFKPVAVRLNDWVLLALFLTLLTVSCWLGAIWT